MDRRDHAVPDHESYGLLESYIHGVGRPCNLRQARNPAAGANRLTGSSEEKPKG